jgi:hypothetical protein
MTKGRLLDQVKVDCAVAPQSLASTASTIAMYYPMKNWQRALAVGNHGPIATTGTVNMEVYQAKDMIGTTSTLIAGATTTTLGTTTKRGAIVSVTLATFLAAGTITITPYIDGTAQTSYVFTAHATTTTLATRNFSIVGTDTADALELLTCINDATYGVPGCFAIQAAGVVTLYPTDDKTTFHIASVVDDGTSLKIVPQGTLLIEVDRSAITWASGFTHIGVKMTTAAGTILCGATLVRIGRWSPTQQCDTAKVAV